MLAVAAAAAAAALCFLGVLLLVCCGRRSDARSDASAGISVPNAAFAASSRRQYDSVPPIPAPPSGYQSLPVPRAAPEPLPRPVANTPVAGARALGAQANRGLAQSAPISAAAPQFVSAREEEPKRLRYVGLSRESAPGGGHVANDADDDVDVVISAYSGDALVAQMQGQAQAQARPAPQYDQFLPNHSQVMNANNMTAVVQYSSLPAHTGKKK